MKTITTIAAALVATSSVALAQPKDKQVVPPPAKPEPMKIPQEITDMAKQVSGTWKCKGETYALDGTKSAMTATNRTKADLDKWWIVNNFEGKSSMVYKFVSYTSYDASAKKWRRVMVDNWGGHMVGTSDGMKDNKMTFNLDAWSPQGASMFRDYVDASDAKVGVKQWGEMSIDKGKTWNKVYEMACKK